MQVDQFHFLLPRREKGAFEALNTLGERGTTHQIRAGQVMKYTLHLVSHLMVQLFREGHQSNHLLLNYGDASSTRGGNG